MKNNIFKQSTVADTIGRINSLNSETSATWGKMNVAQMLAHCNVTYEMVYENIHPKPNMFLKFILTKMVKNQVVSEKPYPKNGKTAPQFVIKGDRDFHKEKERLINYIERTKELGESHFDGKESHSFGKLSVEEWSTMFHKHLDHHLNQFDV